MGRRAGRQQGKGKKSDQGSGHRAVIQLKIFCRGIIGLQTEMRSRTDSNLTQICTRSRPYA